MHPASLVPVGVLVNGAAFFGLRYLVARACGARGVRVVLGIEHRPWAAVALPRRLLFALAGPAGCYLSAVAFVALGLMISGRDVVDEQSMRVRVVPNGPAAAAGLVDDDKILSVNDSPVADWPHLSEAVGRHAGERIRVAVERQGRRLELTPVPGPNGKIGVGPAVEHQTIGLVAALGAGFSSPPKVWASTAKGWAHLLVGREHAEVSGATGIVGAVAQAPAPSMGEPMRLLGALTSYYLFVPVFLALVFFPRRERSVAPELPR